MGINISSRIVAIADISVVIHTNRLGPRQRSALKRMLNTGVLIGRGVPSTIAQYVFEDMGLPYIRVSANYITANDVPLDKEHPLRKAMWTAHSVACMQPEGKPRGRWHRVDSYSDHYSSNNERLLLEATDIPWMYFGNSGSSFLRTAVKHASMDYNIAVPESLPVSVNRL